MTLPTLDSGNVNFRCKYLLDVPNIPPRWSARGAIALPHLSRECFLSLNYAIYRDGVRQARDRLMFVVGVQLSESLMKAQLSNAPAGYLELRQFPI